MSKNKLRPIPYALTQWDSRREVFYKCPVCGQTFKFFSLTELFCHNCGQEIDWSGMPKYCSEEFQKQYEKLVYEEHAFIKGERACDEQLRELMFKLYKQELQ